MVSMCEVYGAFSGGNDLDVTRKLNEMQKPDSRTDYSSVQGSGRGWYNKQSPRLLLGDSVYRPHLNAAQGIFQFI